MGDPVVQIRSLTKLFYGRAVLSNVSFDISPGEVFGYIGPNGAGKTTTLKILAGLISKYTGEVRIGGADVLREREKAHALIGFMPQAAGFQAWRTVEGALDSLGALSGVPAEARKRRVPELLERFDLLRDRTKKVKELSGGMTQKLSLIQALLHEPKLLVLDEPLEGLDPPTRSLLKDVIRERQRAGTTVLFSSHILSDVEDVADRVGILHNGALTTSGSMRELMIAFGMPVRIELELSQPAKQPFLDGMIADGFSAEERKPDQWWVTVPKPREPETDAIIHELVERAIAAGGKLRRVGVVEPELDDLFSEYIRRSAGAANGGRHGN